MTSVTKRCAIYTRKSSEEGLQQDFNSLAAQRESCAAYIASQTGEGWRALSAEYDDGGFSGGNLTRPGLQRLLADVDAGKVDIVVVYKVDRLTRSLADFAKIVDRFEARNASFVSVTQAFNTTTSMGRLTLNVLLSFAQFEREVTSERIRDKIAASKRKGMWMGGYAPHGYLPLGRTLQINPEEAELVRSIYRRYLELKSVPALVAELAAEGVRSKRFSSEAGKVRGGVVFGMGTIRHILSNKVYRGVIVHGAETFPGLHPPLIDQELFDAVQAQLAIKALPRGSGRRSRPKALLAKRVFTETGRPIISVITNVKKGRTGRYYIPSKAKAGERRIPATLIEGLVKDVCHRVLGDETATLTSVSRIVALAGVLRMTVAPAQDSIEHCRARLAPGETIEEEGARWLLTAPLKLRPWRGGTRSFDIGGKVLGATITDAGLLKAIGRAWTWRTQLQAREVDSIAGIARREGLRVQYVGSIIRLAYLSPRLIRETLSGQTPAGLSLTRVLEHDVPREWSAQERTFEHAIPTKRRGPPTSAAQLSHEA